MAELPTPHSIAISTLISLYSDSNSPLLIFDWHTNHEEDDGNDNERLTVGGSRGGGGHRHRMQLQRAQQQLKQHQLDFGLQPQSSAEWSLRLMNLIQQMVMREDEGVVVLPNDGFGLLYDCGDENPADDGDYCGNDDINRNSVIDSIEMENILRNDDDLFKKHSSLLDGQDILEDVLGLFGSSLPSNEPEITQNLIHENSGPTGNHVCRSSSNNTSNGGCLNFSMEPLSTLLDRIDDAYFTSSSRAQHSTRPMRSDINKRTPPSLALLSRLQTASSSVDDLMNLLDEWHALLEGVHVGYPPPPSAANGANNNPTPTIAIDGESTFGVYLRKLCLGMEEIPFEALSRLWDALREFVWEEMKMQAEVQQKRRRKGKEPEEEGGTTHIEGGKGSVGDYVDGEEHYPRIVSDWLPSSPQIERIVRRTCLQHNLDSLLLCHDDVSTLLPPNSANPSSRQTSSPRHDKQQHLHNLLATHPECPSLHFLLYLSSLANGQRCQALESLHRYFDYAMIHERKERVERAIMLQASGEAGEGGGGGVGNITNVGIMGGGMTTMASSMGGITGGMNGTFAMGADAMMQGGAGGQRGGITNAGGSNNANNQSGKLIFKESNVMQYAAILLAQTYHRFGYTRLALQATEEAVRVAQQSGDEECVCFANGWLALVSSSVGSGSAAGSGIAGVRIASSVHASVGGLMAIHGGRNDYRPLAPPSSSGAMIGKNSLTSREEEAMLHRCRARASERGLTSLAAGASLELARRLAYRRHGAGDDAMDDYYYEGGLGGSSQEEMGEREECVSSLAWMSIQSAGRVPSSLIAGSSSATGHHGHLGGPAAGRASGGVLVAQAPTDIYNLSNTEAVGILGRQNIAIAGLWESTGHTSLASLSSYAALYESGSNSGGDGGITSSTPMLNRVLSSFTNGPGSEVWMMNNCLEGVVLDHRLGGRGEISSNAIGRIYATILNNLVLLSEGKHKHPPHHHAAAPNNNNNSEWIFSTASSTLHEWSVRSYDLSIALGLHTLLANRAAFPSPSNGGGGGTPLPVVEASLVFLTHSTHLFLQQEEYDRAKVFARRACWLASRHSLMFHQGWHLLQLALIDLEAASTSSVERALPPLLECLDLSERYSMDPLRAVALATLSKVFLCMGRYGKARAVLHAAMPLVMQNAHVWFQAEGFLTLAKCYLAETRSREEGFAAQSNNELAGSSSGGCDIIGLSSGKIKRQQQQHDSVTLELRETALSQLNKAAFHFVQIEDVRRLRQVYYLQARVCHSLPTNVKNKKQRDEAAKMFARLTVWKRKRVVDSVMTTGSSGGTNVPNTKVKQENTMRSGDKGQQQQWNVLRGVMITDSRELKCCVSIRRKR